ncbi:polyhydroxybutyrate depolymerase [Rhizobium sp. Root274]|uniref:extracellular catalytic domain type 1 short-chain-length polyhydroxyalkanoate depolymerase n=1 Tax=unclassified Rhizobium TaxID=2613769 RepID=UPI000714878D|nr:MULTISPECIES: PHB depolymerase family esterase [unclassified Rhizobium]KQW30922.1 polyhydroxybutyrate depolymerase [Rhizobium sp. Root1240]KRD32466.1 polyhydroxybutyrate depolymerase [Rhizobium sp. Root274]
MRFKSPLSPLSALLKGQRRWRRLVKDAFPTIGLVTPPKAAPKAKARAAASRAALVEVHAFGSNPGRLRMFEFVPALRRDPPTLVVVLHGCLQTAQQFDKGSGWSRMARDKGFVLLYPEQTRENNQNLCFNWFRPSSVARDRGELMSIRQMIDHCARRHNIPADRIFIQGLSAGGAMAGALLASYPDLFAAAQIVGGLPYGAARDAMSALHVMKSGARRGPKEWGDLVRAAREESAIGRPAVSIWHGRADSVVAIANAEATLAQWLDVYGLQREAGTELPVADGSWIVWKDETGKVLVEYRIIDDLDHGLPVPLKRGTAGRQPYMLEGANSAPKQFYESFIRRA